jgi:ATP-dependent DNA ligase
VELGRHMAGERTPRRNEGSRWNAGKDLSFMPLRPERVVEVRYDHMEGERFRHTGQFNRWRRDRDPAHAPTTNSNTHSPSPSAPTCRAWRQAPPAEFSESTSTVYSKLMSLRSIETIN